MNIVLIGYRGSGKSSIGRALAARTGRAFVDTDQLIVETAGCTIKDIFEREGEAGFRTRETAAILRACAADRQIIAAGGGAILRPENVAALTQNATVVWLTATPEVLYARIQADAETSKTRPNLTTHGGPEEVKKILAARLPLYRAAANHELDVGNLSVDEAVNAIQALL